MDTISRLIWGDFGWPTGGALGWRVIEARWPSKMVGDGMARVGVEDGVPLYSSV